MAGTTGVTCVAADPGVRHARGQGALRGRFGTTRCPGKVMMILARRSTPVDLGKVHRTAVVTPLRRPRGLAPRHLNALISRDRAIHLSRLRFVRAHRARVVWRGGGPS